MLVLGNSSGGTLHLIRIGHTVHVEIARLNLFRWSMLGIMGIVGPNRFGVQRQLTGGGARAWVTICRRRDTRAIALPEGHGMADRRRSTAKLPHIHLLDVDRFVRDPARVLVRTWGLAVPLLVVGANVAYGEDWADSLRILQWFLAYLLYVLILETVRQRARRRYESSPSQAIRVSANLALVTWALGISGNAKTVLWLLYLLPILAAIIYFDRPLWTAVTIAAAIGGIYVGGVVLTDGQPFTSPASIAYAAMLAALGGQLHWVMRKALHLEQIIDIARRLHRSLDLTQLLRDALQIGMTATGGNRGVAIVVDPGSKGFLAWATEGLNLQGERSIAELAMDCPVLTKGEPFGSGDLAGMHSSESVYERYFGCRVRSVLAEPIHNKNGELLGALSVTHDASHQFNRRDQQFLRLLGYISSTAIENCLSHRQLRLTEAKKMEVSQALARATDEDEVARSLVSEAAALVPPADGVILHRIKPSVAEPMPWRACHSEKDLPSENAVRVTTTVAAHAAESLQPVTVANVAEHPWFAPTGRLEELTSLASAPLCEEKAGAVIGTLTVYSHTRGAFTSRHEETLVSLCQQASVALTRARALTDAAESSSILERITVAFSRLDVSAPESEVVKAVAELAREILGFTMARVRLVDKGTEELVTVATAGVPHGQAKDLVGQRAPIRELRPLFDPQFKVGRSFLIPDGHDVWDEVPTRHFYLAPQAHYRSDWQPYDALLTWLEAQPEDPIGLLSLDIPASNRRPTAQLIDVIGVFATAAAWAIQRGRYVRQLRENQARAESFLESAGSELAASNDLDAIGKVAVSVGAELIGCEGCTLHLVRDGLLELTHSTHLAGTPYIGRRKPISPDSGSGLVAWVAATGESLRLHEGEHEHHKAYAGEVKHLNYLKSKECRSLLVVPIVASDEHVIGVLHLENKTDSRGRKRFNERDERWAQSLAGQVAAALEKINLLEAAQMWEREGLEDDLHELINWSHSGVALPLEALEEWLAREDLARAQAMAPHLVRQARSTVHALKLVHTSVVSDYLELDDIEKALHLIVSTCLTRSQRTVEHRISVDLPDRFPAEMQNKLLRIAAEAIWNAVLHSGVCESSEGLIVIRLREEKNRVGLVVADNGDGIAPSVAKKGGYGIRRMRQLASQLGGDLSLLRNPQGGTRVVARIPFPEERL
jgi:GAF domain-containing protein/two-component sensor histidine kinase